MEHFPSKQLNSEQQRCLALAAVFQVGQLVDDLAHQGSCDENAFYTSVHSLFTIDAPDVATVFPDPHQLKIGLKQLTQIFSRQSKAKSLRNISRYALSMILLQQQLVKNKAMVQQLRSRIDHTISQRAYFNEINSVIIANLADIYVKSISQLRFRVHIVGKGECLHNETIVNKIRALLLAGIRAAILWQQAGGRRWQLFLTRGKILRLAEQLCEKF